MFELIENRILITEKIDFQQFKILSKFQILK